MIKLGKNRCVANVRASRYGVSFAVEIVLHV